MTDYPCTWWESTGRMSEFEDGISAPIMRRLDTGEEVRSDCLPVGALYAATRRSGRGPNEYPPTGPDGLAVVCVTLETKYRRGRSSWYIDGRASNCTMPSDGEHRCWVRHGTVGERLTVDKSGKTCGAGGGSFFMDGDRWHGFLENGVLVQR